MCYKCLACESKMASILNLLMGSPLNCQLFPYFKVVGSPLSCPLSCPLYSYMEVVGSLIYMAKFPWAANVQPTPLPTCSPWAAKWAALLYFSLWVSLFNFKYKYINDNCQLNF